MKIQDIDMQAIDKAIQSLKGEREDNDQFNAGMYYIRDLIEPYYDNLVKENKRLNNIIDKFEEWLYGEKMTFYRGYNDESYLIAFGDVYSKWKELKGELNEKG
jgi:hypothetical protein